MYLCIHQQLKYLSKEDFLTLRELSHAAKNMYNVGLYNIRQYYFEHMEYLRYNDNYHKSKYNENYRILNSNMAQQILKEVDSTFQSFFALLKKEGSFARIPKYLDKYGYYPLIIGFVRVSNGRISVPFSNSFKKSHKTIYINIPKVLEYKSIKEIRIIPKQNARFFEVQYTYEVPDEKKNLNKQNALAIDLGIGNLCSCVTNDGKSFIIDGRKLKSFNQWFNKENARLQSIKDKQGVNGITHRQAALWNKRDNIVRDYVHKSCSHIIDYCITNNIGTIILGYSRDWQNRTNLGKINNQHFTNLPLGQIRKNLQYRCERYGIALILQEESYTSKASFFDGDIIPVYGEKNEIPKFSGKRIKRGLYEASSGYRYNADINGALNILVKSKVVDTSVLYRSGEVDTPQRIRVA